MFLLGPDRGTVHGSLETLQRALGQLAGGPIAMFPAGQNWLGWFRARQSDALHVFRDAIIVGKLMPCEPASAHPVVHASDAPTSIHPLAVATRIESKGSGSRLTPHNVTNVFHDRVSASDMQLLIAKANGYRPSPEGVAILATVGYFPGELTLFSEISRIPLFHALDLELGCLVRIGRFESQPPDDRAMVDRLASIIPHEGPSVLALSGGCDSRFVLGILRKASQRPTLVRLSDDEDAIPMRIAEELGLPITVVREPAPDPDPELYAVMTDAQIYHRGGHYGRLRRALPAGTAYYTGLFADSLVKNAFRAAWKVPRFRRDMTTRLVEHALLARMRPKEPGLRSFAEKPRLLRFLRERTSASFERQPSSKELAAWFYYAHRGVRWTPAHLADISFFVEPIVPLSDLCALALAIRSGAWANFDNARVRSLNQSLLPEVTVPYSNGQSNRPRRWPRSAWDKLAYEYGRRALVYARGKVANRVAFVPDAPLGVPDLKESPSFHHYFNLPLCDAAVGQGCSRTVSRAAITLNSALRYLDDSTSDRAIKREMNGVESTSRSNWCSP